MGDMGDHFNDVEAANRVTRDEKEPGRMTYAKREFERLGATVRRGLDAVSYEVHFRNGIKVHFWPYTGWYNRIGGKGNGRGIKNCIGMAQREGKKFKQRSGPTTIAKAVGEVVSSITIGGTEIKASFPTAKDLEIGFDEATPGSDRTVRAYFEDGKIKDVCHMGPGRYYKPEQDPNGKGYCHHPGCGQGEYSAIHDGGIGHAFEGHGFDWPCAKPPGGEKP